MLAWLEALPHQLIWTSSWLSLSYAWALFCSSQFEAATVAVQNIERLLKQQEHNCPSANTEMLWGLVTAVKGMQARQRGEVSEAIALIEQALQQLPQEASWLRATIVLNLGVTYFVADNFEPAQGVLAEVSKIGQTRGIATPAIAGLYLQAQFQALRGRMDKAIALCQQGVDLATERGWLATYAGVLVKVAMGEFLREGNQLEAADQHLTEGIERGIQARQLGVMMGYITLARVLIARGSWANPSLVYLDEAMQLLVRLHDFAKAGARKARVMEVLILQALVWQAKGDLERAISVLSQALQVPRKGDYVRLFVDEGKPMAQLLCHAAEREIHPKYVRHLLTAFGSVEGEASVKAQPLIEPLSDRELEVLRYLASGLSNQAICADARRLANASQTQQRFAIADKLFVSLATAKWHARNIYGKLNASNRTQAVAQARELGILK